MISDKQLINLIDSSLLDNIKESDENICSNVRMVESKISENKMWKFIRLIIKNELNIMRTIKSEITNSKDDLTLDLKSLTVFIVKMTHQ